MNKKIIIGTRGSDLAIWQAKYAQNLLLQHGIQSELKIIVTAGDKNQNLQCSFDKLEGKNFFTKEIEDALIEKKIDVAVHSLKDVEAVFYEESSAPLVIAGLSERHVPNDVLILHKDCVDKNHFLYAIPRAKIGTSSVRRYTQLKSLRPDIEVLPLRGNVPTRIQKLKNHQYDGIILAKAGIERLDVVLNDFFVIDIPLHYFVPAAGQGIIAFQTRREDTELIHIIQKISHPVSEECSRIERELLKYMGGGCSKPVGVLCEKKDKKYRLYISFSNEKDQISVLNITEHADSESLVETAKKNIQNIKNSLTYSCHKKIFISTNIDEQSYLKRLISRLNWTIFDKSFITTKALPVDGLPDFDWIFFSSKNAVKYFLDSSIVNKNKLKNKKIACISQSTCYYLEKHELSAHFVGTGNDVKSIAQQFSEICQNQTVLFPCSNISTKSVGNCIKLCANVVYLPIYETIEIPEKINIEFDYLIFTSPSNVRAFLKMNTVSSFAKFIAIGKSTKEELVKHGISPINIIMPVAFDEIAIAGALTNLI